MNILKRIKEALFGKKEEDFSYTSNVIPVYFDPKIAKAANKQVNFMKLLEDITEKTDLEVISTTKAKFEIFKGEDEDIYFRLKAPNGKIVATGEGYSDKRGAQRGIAAVKKYAAKAKVEEIQ